MILKSGSRKYKCILDEYNVFNLLKGSCELAVSYRKYSPQSRTIKAVNGKASNGDPLDKFYLNFPILHFYKYEFNNIKSKYAEWQPNKFYYSCLLEEGDKLKIFNSENIRLINGGVCLGSATDDCFFSSKDVEMDEFISLFWQSRFTYFWTINGNYNAVAFNKILPVLDLELNELEASSNEGGIECY